MKLKNLKQTLILILLTTFANAIEYQEISYVSVGGNIERVTPTHKTTVVNPSVALSVSAVSFKTDEPIDFNASIDAYALGVTLNYVAWDFDSDGTIDKTTETLETTHTFSEAKAYEATVYVVDSRDGVLEAKSSFVIEERDVPIDTDGDGIPNSEDPDDDNDGILDVDELRYGLNPLDPSDATQDADGDGVSNIDEVNAGGDPWVKNYYYPLTVNKVTCGYLYSEDEKIKCGQYDDACSFTYLKDTNVTLRYYSCGIPQLAEYTGDCSGKSCELTMNTIKNVAVIIGSRPVIRPPLIKWDDLIEGETYMTTISAGGLAPFFDWNITSTPHVPVTIDENGNVAWNNMQSGEYNLTVGVSNRVGSSTMMWHIKVIDNNVPPVVNAGADQTIIEGESASLQCVANDVDGSVTSTEWLKDGVLV
ncbi:MAG: PKD domain-containing protein, partial [Campylobacterota bacterium]|nr:PKD domain-containing protein [Campylobacterota bacterium]